MADRLVRHLDPLLTDGSRDSRWTIAYPKDATSLPMFESIGTARFSPFTGQLWEQLRLPAASRGSLLLNLCNLAPLADSGGITMIHDAQVFLSPQSYSSAFSTWYRHALPRIGGSASRIITVSEYSRRQLAHFGVCDYDKIDVIHNGADHILDSPCDPASVIDHNLEFGTYVVALASVAAHKNIGILLTAFARPELASAKLVLVGRAGPADFHRAGMNATSNVIFAGTVTDGRLRGLLQNAAALAFPSTTEGFGLPPLEAMTLGCPVITTECGAVPEVCRDGAVYVPPDDPSAWAAEICRMIGSASHQQTWAKKGKARAEIFKWDLSARRLATVVNKALSY